MRFGVPRNLNSFRRTGPRLHLCGAACGYGPVPTPDTASAFLSDLTLSTAPAAEATSAVSYSNVSKNLQVFIGGYNYLGAFAEALCTCCCAAECDGTKRCVAYNICEQRKPWCT